MKDRLCRRGLLLLLAGRPLFSSMTYPWSDWVFGAAAGILFAVALAGSPGRTRELKSWYFLLCCVFLLSTVVAFLRSSCAWDWALAGLCQGLQIAFGAMLGRWFLAGTQQFNRYCQAILVCILYLTFDAYGELHGGLDEMEEYVRMYRPNLLANEELVIRLRDRAAFATFFYPNALAGFAVLAVWLGAAGILGASGGVSLFLPTAGLMGAVYLLLAAKSEGGFLAAAFGAACMGAFLLLRFERPKRIKVLLAAAGGLVVLFSLLLATGRIDWLLVNLYKSGEVRWGYWVTAWRMILHRPFLGMGFGGYETYFTDYAPAWADYARNPHSLPLQLWMERGVLGILSAVLLGVLSLGGGLGRLKRAFREERIQDGLLWCCGLAGVGACLFHSLGEVDLSVSGIMMPLSVLLGILSADKE